MKRARSKLGLLLVLGMLTALLPIGALTPAAAAPEVVAFDMVGSASQNLVSYTNSAPAFTSPADGFAKYQRNVSATIPFAVLDDSLSFPSDDQGVVKDGNTDVFFGVADTVNDDNTDPVSATWVFDISGAGDLSMSIDMGAMGDFESSDVFTWEYSIDGGATNTAFVNAVDEAGVYTYTLESGASVTLNDPMLMNGTVLTNDMATFTAPLTGTGSELTLTLTASTNGGDEAFTFQNITIESGGAPPAEPLAISCGADVVLDRGVAGSVVVTAVDPDDIASISGVVVDPVPTSGSITLTDVVPAGALGATATATIAIDDVVGAGTYEATVFATNGAGDTESCVVSIYVAERVLINEIQGADAVSPLEGDLVTIEGIVVGDFEGDATFGSQLNGFFVQEEDVDADADDNTSEGIFVYDPANLVEVMVGDLVEVTGTVAEYESGGSSMTQVGYLVAASVGASGVPLPTATEVLLPMSADEDLERLEAMLVVAGATQDLYISEYFNYDRFGEIVLTDGRAMQPTAVFDPGSTAAADLAEVNARSRITLDDGRTSSNPDPARHPDGTVFDMDNLFRGGDILRDVYGVVDHRFGYKLQPTSGALHIEANPRKGAADDVGGSLKVASFNVLNYFTTIDNAGAICGPLANQGCRGADTTEEFDRQRAKIIAAISAMDADIVGLMEIENNAADPVDVPLDDLVAGLNEVVGAGTYAYVNTGSVGPDAIKVALIYKPASVTPYGAYAVLETPEFLNPFGYVDDEGNPDYKNRAALAQTFTEIATGEAVTVAVNHLKSKGSSCAPGDDDPEAGSCNLTRKRAAEQLAAWLTPANGFDDDVLIIGDLNSYDKEDPIYALLAAGYSDLIFDFLGEFAYSYVFDGQLGYLDYAMANATLQPKVTGTTVWHINADEPDIIDYDTSFKKDAQDALYAPDAYRASDHDPVIVGLDLAAPVVTAELDRIWAGYRTGLFEVDFSCTDLVDPDPECVGTINNVEVEDGQKVFLIKSRWGKAWSKLIGETLFIKDSDFILTVTGTDDAGNTATATAEPTFRQWRRWSVD